ncbi:YaaW family protein [Argonema antarcticum]|uniref:YaaW family protein n=1 Tax=Argonema antarcticum TaxID=2942763 RepID=UPI002012BADF|nr:YaaW family protein [Argonema antarcticum]MCL1472985.1 YaaW family protein [Argonema antarcticum A004/B2]
MDELRSALELATEEELQQLTAILFCRRFNPLDYVGTLDPIEVQSHDREAWLDILEDRFRFLAADGLTVLRGRTQEVSYRQTLIQVCRYLKIRFSNKLSTTDIEAEIFLHLLKRAWKQLPTADRDALTIRVQESLAETKLSEPLPLSVQRDPLGWLVKGGSAFAVSSIVKPMVLQQIAHQFALHFARYQIAREAAVSGGLAAVTKFQSYAMLQTAERGMALSAARYSAVRGVFAFLGPALWTWFFADLGWRAIATNYARIIPTIFALAQIRLTRTECWQIA